ncbi:MAG: RCC1 domain-containing protein, partial [Bacteroidia bacterium]
MKIKSISRNIITLVLLIISFNNCLSQTIDGGNGHAIILDQTGQVWTIGRNNYGQLGDSSLTNNAIPKKVKQLTNIKTVSRGYDHSIAIDSSGNLYLWGRNNYGQIGSGSANDQLTPYKLMNHTGFKAVEGGHWHTVALKENGSVWAWGHNYFAELGNGTREHSSWPVQVRQESENEITALTNVISIASVGYHTLALKSDGTVWGWGTNTFNELGKKGAEFQPYAKRITG